MIKSVFRYILFVPISLAATILNYPLAPIVVLFADKQGWLPSWLWWFQTPDNSLDGDDGWKAEHRWFRYSPDINGGWRRWVNRFRWLWRNSMHGFEQSVLGFMPGSAFAYSCSGNQETSNRPLSNGAVCRAVINQSGKTAFQLYIVRTWSKSFCLRINLGWKIWQNPKPGQYCQHVFSINPFMGYER
jgi:hypothetical protein